MRLQDLFEAATAFSMSGIGPDAKPLPQINVVAHNGRDAAEKYIEKKLPGYVVLTSTKVSDKVSRHSVVGRPSGKGAFITATEVR